MHTYGFESYGVRIRVDCNDMRAMQLFKQLAIRSLVGRMSEIDPNLAEHRFLINYSKEKIDIDLDGEVLADSRANSGMVGWLDSRIRILVAEYAKDLVFMHAGVVGWNGKALVFPANSYSGKTTVVEELVRQGAEYYSDEYAIFDTDGLVHPFPRPLSIRDENGEKRNSDLRVETFGGRTGSAAIPVGAVILTEFKRDGEWKLEILTAGVGVVEMIPQTFPIRVNTQFTLSVLQKVASNAIILKGFRGEAEKFAETILNFIDKAVN